MKRFHREFFITARVAVLAIALALGGCATTMKFGAPPQFDQIDLLTVGESRTSDIIVALGQPRGGGRCVFSQDLKPRDIWYYEYLETDGKRVQVSILVVLILNERYEGYLWFSSLEKREVKGIPVAGLVESARLGGYFPPVAELETGLVLGRSSREQVLSKLGQPSGTGGALLPPLHSPQEVLFYEDIQVKGIDYAGRNEVTMDIEQRMLLVFLEDGLFEGFMWNSNVGAAELH